MPKRPPADRSEPLTLRPSLVERLLARRHLVGKNADERAQLAYLTANLIFCCLLAFGVTLWGLSSGHGPAVLAVNLTAMVLFVADLLFILRYGRVQNLAMMLALQMAALLVAIIAVHGRLEPLVGLTAPASLLLFLVSLRSAYVATAGAMLAALVLGVLRARGMLLAVEVPSSAWLGPGHVVIVAWILGNLPLMAQFESRRRWAADEALLISRVLGDVRLEMKRLLIRLCRQLEGLMAEPSLGEPSRESLQEVEASARRLGQVIEQLGDEPAAPEPAADEQRSSHRRFLKHSSNSLLITSVIFMVASLWLKGPDHGISHITIASFVVYLLSAWLVRRAPDAPLTVVWIGLQMSIMTAIAALISGYLPNAIWMGLAPIVLLYLLGARWAMWSALLLVVLTSVLAVILDQGVEIIEPLTGSRYIDHAIISAAFIAVSMFMFGYFEKDRIAAADLMTLKSGALSRVSHELRTPLNGILGMLSLAHDDLPAGEDMSERLAVAEVQGVRLLSVVDDALSLAALNTGRAQRKRVELELDDIVRWLQHEAERLSTEHNFEIAFELPQLPRRKLLVEAERLCRILTTLLEWICDSCADQAVDVHLRLQQRSRGRLELLVELVGRELVKTQDDTLPGMAEALKRTGRSFDHHLLRVALCRAQVEFLGGQLEVLREDRKGLRLCVPLKQLRTRL